MTRRKRHSGRAAVGLLALAIAGGSPVIAPARAEESGSTMTRLIQLMVKNGVLTREQAEPLLQEAEQEARAAKHVRAPAATSAKPARPAAIAAGTAAAATDVPAPGPSVHVTYVPPLVRQQIAAEVRQQMAQEQQAQGNASAGGALPDWTQRIRVFGDIRVRGEEDMLSGTNSPFFPDFNAINQLSNGFDSTSGAPVPLLNTTENRTRLRLRARLGVDAQIDDWVSTEVRVGTGNDRSPVTENQTLGVGGDFSKYAIWLDRAFIRLKPNDWLSMDLGREPNPFWTTPLLFNDDLNFDGVALQARHAISSQVIGFVSAGGFPVFNTDFNFGSTNTEKTNSHDAYLVAVQGGAEWKINQDFVAKAAAGYFNFLNVQGSRSAPCEAPTGYGSCSTDDERPGWVQFGNTLFPLRNIVANPSATTGVTANPQFYGLASRFDLLEAHAEFAVLGFHPVDIVLGGEYVKNLGYNAAAIAARGPVNNLSGANSVFTGGDTGYLVQVTVGHQQLEKIWDWNFNFGYRYISSDAVLDALNDSDFHLGGTNAKGYSVVANLALGRNVWFDSKFYSATQVSGAPYTANVLLVDLNAKF